MKTARCSSTSGIPASSSSFRWTAAPSPPSRIVDTNGSGHGALAGFLAAHHVDALICGGIGGGARTALAQAGIQLYPGVSGDADQAVAALLAGQLSYDPDTVCSHHEHDHGHDCATHDCAQDHQGCPGNH